MALDPCDKCEEVMQPYLDRALDESERAEAEAHLAGCGYCRKRYRFEESATRLRPRGLRRGDAARAEAEARRAPDAALTEAFW